MQQVTHSDGTWNGTEYFYKGWKILVKSRKDHGMKAHAFNPATNKVEFTLRYIFIPPDKLLTKVKNKIDKILNGEITITRKKHVS